MLDPLMRRLIDPPLKAMAAIFPDRLTANQITLSGFALGLGSVACVAQGEMMWALLLLLLNRLADGLDGAVARRHEPTDLGGYLDIVADFLLWALLPLGFMLREPTHAFAAAILLSSFAMSMTVFLAFAVLAEKRGQSTDTQGSKSFFYIAGLAEGTETILFFVLVMLAPHIFDTAALIFAAYVYVSVLGRIGNSFAALK